MEKKKMGRPTTNPKDYKLTIRLDNESETILNEYSREKNVTKAEAVRIGIKRLKKELKK